MILKNKRGFAIPIPQMISGILAFFIAIIGIRIFSPIIFMVTNFAWKSTQAQTMIQIVVWLIMFFLVYVIVYGTIMGKTPNILGTKTNNTGMMNRLQGGQE
jgi:ABC-type amino acid transport system permease subunit